MRVLVVDDEPLARSGVRRLLEQDPDVEVVGECGDGLSAIDAIRALRPDLVLLDVQMPECDGFEVIREIGEAEMPAVIFITAFNEFAVRAFEVCALDYLVKPFDDERFVATLERAKRALESPTAENVSRRLAGLLEQASVHLDAGDRPARPRRPDRIIVKDRGKAVFVRVSDIDWVEAADYYVKLHVGGQTLLHRATMAAMEGSLDESRFARVHRSAIVNLDRIREIQPYFHDEHIIILRDGTQVRLSRGRRAKLEARLGQRL